MAETTAPPSQEDGNLKSLAHQINMAIASSHSKINRLILDRMPKAVPPQADNPSTYITGLLHIGAVYIAFESLWQNMLGIHSEIAPIPYTFPFANDPSHYDETPQITERTRHLLHEAYWPNMLRAARAKADIRSMTCWPDHVIDEQIRLVGATGQLGKLTHHIRDSVNAKPHLLLAYVYCLYLALLSGGSYIRTELMYLKSDFWQATPTAIRPNMVECGRRPSPAEYDAVGVLHGLARHNPTFSMPLQFLDFDPPLGENPRKQAKKLKAEFTRRFTTAEQSLADLEREEIIQEASTIFHHLAGVVAQLDQIFASTIPSMNYVQRALHPLSHVSKGPRMGFRLRDSIAIAKGRLLRRRRKSSISAVSATDPAVTDDMTEAHFSASSKPPSLSDTWAEDEDAEPVPRGSKSPSREKQADSDLARHTMIPSDFFRTIRYEEDLPRPDRSRKGAPDNSEKREYVGQDSAGFDGADSDVDGCPRTRTPDATMNDKISNGSAMLLQQKEGPTYVLYAVVISNFVLLFGLAIVSAAHLFVGQGNFKLRP